MPTVGDVALIRSLIRDVPDFPEPGVVFKDIMPLLRSPQGFRAAIDTLLASCPDHIDVVVGMEARGFLFAAPMALELGAGLVPVRKPGKLPGSVISESYDLEYGTNTLAVPDDAIRAGQRVLVVDDVLATGGTVGATAALLQRLGAELVHVAVLLELSFLDGRRTLADSGVTRFSSVIVV